MLQCLEIAVKAPGSEAKAPVIQLHGLLHGDFLKCKPLIYKEI